MFSIRHPTPLKLDRTISRSVDVMQSCHTPQDCEPQELDFECRICLEAPSEPCVTRCGHLFCTQCLRQWLEFSPKCPACKARTGLTEVVPIFATRSRRLSKQTFLPQHRGLSTTLPSSINTNTFALEPPAYATLTKNFFPSPSSTPPPGPLTYATPLKIAMPRPQPFHLYAKPFFYNSPDLLPSPAPFHFTNEISDGLDDENDYIYLSESDDDETLVHEEEDQVNIASDILTLSSTHPLAVHRYLSHQFSRALSIAALALMVTVLLAK